MKYKLITHDKDGKELADPTMQDLCLYQEIYVKDSDGDYRAPILAFGDGQEIHVLGPDGYSVQVELYSIYPILWPLEELMKITEKNGLPEKLTGYSITGNRIYDAVFDADNWTYFLNFLREELFINDFINALLWLRDNSFCTADFRFSSEVKHAHE